MKTPKIANLPIQRIIPAGIYFAVNIFCQAPSVAQNISGDQLNFKHKIGQDIGNTDIRVVDGITESTRGPSRLRDSIDRFVAQAKVNIATAYQAMNDIKSASDRIILRVEVAKRILSADFSKIGEIFRQVTDSSERGDILSSAVPREYRKDPKRAMLILREQLKGEILDIALVYVVREQVDAGDFSSAVVTQLSMPLSYAREQAVVSIAGKYGAHDFDAAVRWLKQLDPKKERRSGCVFIQSHLLEVKDYVKMQRLLPIIGEPLERSVLIRAITSTLIHQGNTSVQRFADSLPPEEQVHVQIELIACDTDTPLHERLEHALALGNPLYRWRAVAEIVSREKEPRTVALAAASLPEDSQTLALSPVVTRWAERDAKAVFIWIQELPKGRLKDLAAKSYVETMRYKDRSTALEAAEWITSDELRQRTIKYLQPR